MPDQLARQRSTTLLFYGCVILLGYLLYQLFEPFLRPLAWAAIFAAFFHSRHKQLEARFGKTAAASISTAAVALIIVVPFVLIVMAFIDEARQTLGSIDLAAGGSRGLERVQRGVELAAAPAIRAGHPESRRRPEDGRVANRRARHRRRRPARAQHRRAWSST